MRKFAPLENFPLYGIRFWARETIVHEGHKIEIWNR